MAKNWRGFEAKYVEAEGRGQQPVEPAWRTEQRERMRAFAPGITVPGPRRAAEVFDLEEVANASAKRLG